MRIVFGFLSLFSVCVCEETIYPTIVLGGGIGALTSSLYLARAGRNPLIIEGQTKGGLLTQSHSVQNWPGELEIPGQVLAEKMRAQVLANGAEIYAGEVVSVDFSKRPFKINTKSTDGDKKIRSFFADSCIIAMGTQPNYLGIPGESGPDGYWGRGVTNCAICDGNLYRGARVGVVGGGDAAVLEALYLSNIAKEVTLFVRKDKLRAQEKKRVDQLLSKENVKVMYNTQVSNIKGDKGCLVGVDLNVNGEKKGDFPLEGLFLAIGSTPNSGIFKGTLTLDSQGYIVTDKAQKTSVDGVYAVGDIVDPIYKQAVTASGDGAKAALEVQQYISDRDVTSKKGIASSVEKESFPGEVVEIRNMEEFHKELRKNDIPILVDFYAPWCGPCKKVSPAFEESAARLGGKVRFLKVNVDRLSNLGEQYNIRSLPTVIFFDQAGDISDRQVGLGPIRELLNKLD